MVKGKMIAAAVLLAAVCGLGGMFVQTDDTFAAQRAASWDGTVIARLKSELTR